MGTSKEDRLFLELALRRGFVSQEAAQAARARGSSGPILETLVAADALKLADADQVRSELERLAFECSRCGNRDFREIGAPRTESPLCETCAPPRATGRLASPAAPPPEPQWPPRANAEVGFASSAQAARPVSERFSKHYESSRSSNPREASTQRFTEAPGTSKKSFDADAKTLDSSSLGQPTQAMVTPGGEGPPASEVAEGQEIGGCRIGRKLGQGGMGRVYHAHHTGLDRDMAVKVLDPKLVNRKGFVDQFFIEARTLAKLDHPNIVRVFNVGKDDTNRHFIVMELLEGGSVEHLWRKKQKQVPIEDAVRIVKEAAEGLLHAHQNGLIHRDVKPGNLMLTRDGRVKVVDFGLAVPTKDDLFVASEIAGTPVYMAPEQADARPLDARCDQYALGVSLYQLLCGRAPFEKDKAIEILFAQIAEAPQPPRELRPDVPAWLENIILKMLAKSAADRFPSLEEVVRALGERERGKTQVVPASEAQTKIITVAEIDRLEKELVTAKAVLPRWGPAVGVAAASVLVAVAFFAGFAREAFGHVDTGKAGDVPRSVERDAREALAQASASAPEMAAAIARLDEEIEDMGSRPGAQRLDEARTALKKALADARAKTETALPLRIAELVKKGRHGQAFDIADPDTATYAALQLVPLATEQRKKVALALASERGEVYVPAGAYKAGADGHDATLGAFYLDRTEVTNKAWAAAMEKAHLAVPAAWPSGQMPAELAERPVTGVSFEEARAYAKAVGKRLPTTDEWEKAARGREDARAFPWGTKFEPGRANLLDGGAGGLEDVGARPGDVSPYGAVGMAGNALEWVVGANGALVAGGGYRSQSGSARVYSRFALDPGTRHAAVGFRCARDVEGDEGR